VDLVSTLICDCLFVQEHHFEDPAPIMDVYPTGQDMPYGTLFKQQGFRRPILFKNVSGLHMKVPSRSSFDIDSVAALVGTPFASQVLRPFIVAT